jgi:hypothetical protein
MVKIIILEGIVSYDDDRRDGYNIDMNNFQLHMKIYHGIEEGTWFL